VPVSVASPIGVDGLHGYAVGHKRESVLLVERGVLAFLGHDFDIQVVAVLLLDHLDHMAGDAASLVCGVDQHVMHVREHRAVVQRAHQTDQAVAVPRGDHRRRAEQRPVQVFRVLAGRSSDRQEQLLHLILRELLLFGVCDVGIRGGHLCIPCAVDDLLAYRAPRRTVHAGAGRA